ncbi:MAG: SGNH/GDSL hydrolase family protein [Planctomycetota bacterium]|nr:SGNH/GDSL hydrolase family protein [Planctomycetota bacterium]
MAKKILYSAIIITAIIGILELGGRFLLHVGPAQFVTSDGDAVDWLQRHDEFARAKPDLNCRLLGGEFNVEVITDPDGCRVQTHEVNSRPFDVEVLVVGDSISFGWGVEFEQTFARTISRSASIALGTETGPASVSLVNLSCPGTGVNSQRHRLEQYLDEHPADGKARVVVWTLLLNDGYGGGNDLIETAREIQNNRERALQADRNSVAATSQSQPGTATQSRLYQFKSWLGKYSVCYEIGMRLAGGSVRRLVPKKLNAQDRVLLDQNWLLLQGELEAARLLCDRYNVGLIFGYYPYFHDVSSDSERTFNKLQESLPTQAKLVSLLPALHSVRNTYVFPRDGHPNAIGHAMVALTYAPYVVRELRTRAESTPRIDK